MTQHRIARVRIEAAARPTGTPMASCACGRDASKSPARSRNLVSRLGVMPFADTSHERSISSRSLALSLYECFVPFPQPSSRCSNASRPQNVLVLIKSSSVISSGLSGGARRYGHDDESSWKERRDRAQERCRCEEHGVSGGRRCYNWNRFGRRPTAVFPLSNFQKSFKLSRATCDT